MCSCCGECIWCALVVVRVFGVFWGYVVVVGVFGCLLLWLVYLVCSCCGECICVLLLW